MDDVLQDKAGGYTGSSGDQADLDFSKVGAMEQPGFGDNPSAPVARVLQIVMVETGKDKKMCIRDSVWTASNNLLPLWEQLSMLTMAIGFSPDWNLV